MTNLTTIVFLHQNITPKMTKYVGQYITNRSVSDFFLESIFAKNPNQSAFFLNKNCRQRRNYFTFRTNFYELLQPKNKIIHWF